MAYNTPNLPMSYTVSATINGLVNDSTQIGVVDPTLTFMPQTIIIQCITASGLVTLPTISVGTNSTTYNNIFSALLLVGTGSASIAKNFSVTNAITPVPGGTAIFVNVSGIAVATAFTFKITVLGLSV